MAYKSKEERSAAFKAYYRANHEAMLARRKAYYDKFQRRPRIKMTDEQLKETLLERQRRYREKNKEAIRNRTREWKAANKERLNKQQRERYKNDPVAKMVITVRNRIRSAIRSKKSIKSMDLVGCTGAELKSYIESKFLKGMTWENHGLWHVDHILPCASFDLTKISHQKRCFHYTNLQPLWGADNLRKNKKAEPIHQLKML